MNAEQNDPKFNQQIEFFQKCLDDEDIYRHYVLSSQRALCDYEPAVEVCVYRGVDNDIEIMINCYGTNIEQTNTLLDRILSCKPNVKQRPTNKERHQDEIAECMRNGYPLAMISIGNDSNNPERPIIFAAMTKNTPVNEQFDYIQEEIKKWMDRQISQN